MTTAKQKTLCSNILHSGVHLEEDCGIILVLNLGYRASFPCLSCLTLAHKLDAVVVLHAHNTKSTFSVVRDTCVHTILQMGFACLPNHPPRCDSSDQLLIHPQCVWMHSHLYLQLSTCDRIT